jgi:hypothetical protein
MDILVGAVEVLYSRSMKELTVLMISRVVADVEVTNLSPVIYLHVLKQSTIKCRKTASLTYAVEQQASSIFDAFSRWHILPGTRTTHANLGRVEFRGGGTVGETLSTGVDSLVTELLPVLSVLPHNDWGY